MKMTTCTKEQFDLIIRKAEGLQTSSEGGHSHLTLYYERNSIRKGWQTVGIARKVCGEWSYEVPTFLFEAYVK